MGYSVICLGIFINVFSTVVGRLEYDPPTPALDNNLYKDVLDENLCDEQISAIRENPQLAMFFLDAGIRIPKGILVGNTIDMGSYHQCINFYQPLPNSDLRGKYCVINVPTDQNVGFPGLPELPEKTIKAMKEYKLMRKAMNAYAGIIDDGTMPNNPLSGLQLTLAVCVPRPCTTRQAIDSFLFNVSALGFEYTDVYCRLPDDRPWVPVDYVVIIVFSLLAIVTLLSTSYDLWHTFVKKSELKEVSVVRKSFSVYTNGSRLMTFNSSANTLDCIDGIRALSMAWVVLGHTFSNEVSFSNPLDTFTFSQSWKALWVTGSHYSVDTFFTLSGFLVVYSSVGKVTSSGLIKSLHLFYLNRLLRMFPLLAIAVLLEASYLNRMTDGPDWNVIAGHVNNCRATWWSTLLHLQNIMTPGTLCMIQSWYLAIDVQLHILSPIILVWVLHSNRKIVWTALVLGVLSVVSASTIFNFMKNLPPVMVAPGRENEIFDYLVNYYMNTLTRAPPFVIGMAFGYLVRISKAKITICGAAFFWTLFFALTTYLMYLTYPVNQVTWDDQLLSNLYNSFVRTLWAISVCGLIYACVNGFAGPINWFLSLSVWKIHSRLSYAMYLFHYMLMVAINNTAVTPVYFTLGLMTFKFLAYYVLTLIVSFLMTLLIDLPFSTIFKLVLGGGVKKEPSKIK